MIGFAMAYRLRPFTPGRLALRLAVTVLVLAMAGCVGSLRLEPRDGYVADHRHAAPSHSSRVRHLVLHYTGGDQAHSLGALTGPHVSAHYLVPLPTRRARGEPRIYQLVDESRRAWHAGASRWRDRSNINDTSIGIEIVNRGPLDSSCGDAWAPFPPAQIEALIALARDIVARHGIEATDVVAHADIAPSRKIDPGPRFPWRQLHEAGIGAWPEEATVAAYLAHFRVSPPSLVTLQRALAAYGYPLHPSGVFDDRTRHVLRAFQMHFRPSDYSGVPDARTAAILWALLARYRPGSLDTLAFIDPGELPGASTETRRERSSRRPPASPIPARLVGCRTLPLSMPDDRP